MKRPAFRVGFYVAAVALLPSGAMPAAEAVQRGYTIPLIDLAGQTQRQVVVDREPGQYLGHPTTVLLEDGKTMIAVYPKGHGRGAIVKKRSTDGGRTWCERLPTPASWATSKEVPDPPSRRRCPGNATPHRVLRASTRSAWRSPRTMARPGAN